MQPGCLHQKASNRNFSIDLNTPVTNKERSKFPKWIHVSLKYSIACWIAQQGVEHLTHSYFTKKTCSALLLIHVFIIYHLLKRKFTWPALDSRKYIRNLIQKKMKEKKGNFFSCKKRHNWRYGSLIPDTTYCTT